MTGLAIKVGSPGRTSFEQALVDDTLYVKAPELGGGWVKVATNVDSMFKQGLISKVNPGDFLMYFHAAEMPKALADENVNGVDCYHFSFEVDEQKVIRLLTKGIYESSEIDSIQATYEDLSIIVEAWTGKNNQLPYREKMEIRSAGNPTGAFKTTIEFFDFNKKVEIEAPAGARELSKQ